MTQSSLDQLTERQRELLDLVAGGVTKSKEISARTGIAAGTVDNVLQQAAKTLGVTGREAAAERYIDLKKNSHEASHVRISPLPIGSDSALSDHASSTRKALTAIADFFRGPPLGGEEHQLRWDQITMQVLRVAVVGMIAVIALVLLVLGFFKTFG